TTGWARTASDPSLITCAQGRLDHVTADNQTGPAGPDLQQQPHRSADSRNLFGPGGHLEPQYRAGDEYRPDAGDWVLQPVHFDDPQPDPQLDPHDRADGDHCFAGDPGGSGAQSLCLFAVQTAVGVRWSDHHQLYRDG